ncbi:MAG: DUF1501 domain-containing protein [Planctomycetaceae bacterium]|nr:DUF1501 domain-containing protein [Planctomycetaceae bacterium]
MLNHRPATRRDVVRLGALSLFSGVTLPRLLQSRAVGSDARPPAGRARSVVLFNMLGGPSHMDMFDMKPEAPVEVRGEFTPVSTSLPGLHVCEHLPRVAQWMHRTTLIRTVTHGYNAHNPLNIMTGYSAGNLMQLRPEPTDPPDIGAICQYLKLGPADMPGAVCLPCFPGFGERSMYPGIQRPGPYGGFLGSQYDPLFAECEPTFEKEPPKSLYDPVWAMGAPTLPARNALAGMNGERMDRRRALYSRIDEPFEINNPSPQLDQLDFFQQQAFSMLGESRVQEAFDLAQESDATRDRYGRTLFGSSMLIARRLVEAGVPYISVHAENFIPYGFTYDMHENNFGMLKNYNLPVFDQLYTAFLQDLVDRGLFDSTLVIAMGEMGRSPRVNSKAGRDHWPQCGFSLLAGGGVREGLVYGETDNQAGYPISHPVSPADLVSTVYHLLGIDHHTMVPDRANRPHSIAHGGEPIWDVIA